jgi:hypothetical protein
MQFESKLKRTYWTAILLGAIPDLLIAAILTRVFEGGWVGFLLALVGLQLLYLALWVKNSLWAWAIFSLFGRRHLASLFLDYLRENAYPEPDTFERSAEGYFSEVAESSSLPVDVRLKAAAQLSALRFPASQGQIQHAVRLSMAFEDALEAYKRGFPQKAG